MKLKIMKDKQNKNLGRPTLTDKELENYLDDIFRRIEPYLKSGLSVNKACNNSQISKSMVYKYIQENENFAEKIKHAQQFISVIFSKTIVKQLHKIIKKQNDGVMLTKEDIDFLKWFAVNSNLTREEFGRRENIQFFDPETEIQRIANIIDQAATKDELSK